MDVPVLLPTGLDDAAASLVLDLQHGRGDEAPAVVAHDLGARHPQIEELDLDLRQRTNPFERHREIVGLRDVVDGPSRQLVSPGAAEALRPSQGVDRTTVVRVETLAAERIRAKRSSRLPGVATLTLRM